MARQATKRRGPGTAFPAPALPVLALLAAAASAHAEGLRDVCADRPGKATPACILDAGHLQLETGLADVAFDHGSRDWLLGATEIRLGVSRRTEIEAGLPPLSLLRGGGDHAGGLGDLTLGLRTALTDPDRGGVAVSAQAFVTAPTATHGQGAGGWEGGARLPVSVPLPGGFGLGLTPELDVRRDSARAGVHAAESFAASLSHAVGAASVAVELWAQRDPDPGAHAHEASFDVSAAWMLGADSQVDIGANAGLTHATPGLELYVGVARRF